MKKILLTSCVCFATQVAFCKVDSLGINDHKPSKRPFFRLGMGYAMPLSPDMTTISSSVRFAGTSKEVQTYEQTAISMGQGFSGVLGMGYYLGQHMAIEAAIAPGFSRSLPTATYSTDTSSYRQFMKAAPATTLQLNVMIHTSGPKLQFYSRAGILASFANKITTSIDGTVATGYNVRETLELDHKTAMGLCGAIGARKEISRNVHLWGEVSTVMLASYLETIKIKDITVNGTNVTSYIPANASSRRYDFSGTTTKGSDGTFKTGSDPYSNWGINAGITFDIDAQIREQERRRKGGAYLVLALGYGVPLAGKTSGIEGSRTATYKGSTTPETEVFELKRASYMAGISGKAGIGYMFGKNVGFECDAMVGLSTKRYEYTTEEYYTLSPGTYSEKSMTQSRATSPLFLVPSFVLRSGGARVSAHIRTGIVVPARVNVTVTNTQYGNITGSTDLVQTATYKLKTKFALGASMSVGAGYSFSDHMRLFAEMTGISYAPTVKTSTLTEITQNGESFLENVPEEKRTIHYTKSGSYGPGVSTGYTNRPSYTLPFGSVGMMVGVDFSL